MTPRHLTATLAAAAALALAACGGGTSTVITPPAAPRTTASSTAASSPAAATSSAPAAVPSPDNAQQAALLTALNAVQSGLADDTDQAVSYARNVCQYVLGGDTAGAQGYAVSRAAADGITVTAAQGAAVVAAVQSTFCS